jgi:hypothetical protein
VRRFLLVSLPLLVVAVLLGCEEEAGGPGAGATPQVGTPVQQAVSPTVAVEPTKVLPSPVPTEVPPTTPPEPTRPPLPTDTPVVATTQFVSVTSPVPHGANATVVVQTASGAQCSITVIYKSGPSEAQGLVPKQADSNGRVSWSWKVGTRTTPGEWPIIVTCGGQTIQTTFRVT